MKTTDASGKIASGPYLQVHAKRGDEQWRWKQFIMDGRHGKNAGCVPETDEGQRHDLKWHEEDR